MTGNLKETSIETIKRQLEIGIRREQEWKKSVFGNWKPFFLELISIAYKGRRHSKWERGGLNVK